MLCQRCINQLHELHACSLEPSHSVAAEGLRVCEELHHTLAAAGGKVPEVAGIAGKQFSCLIINLALGAAEERLNRVNDVALRVEQIIGDPKVCQVPLIGFARDGLQQCNRCFELSHKWVLRAANSRLEFV